MSAVKRDVAANQECKRRSAKRLHHRSNRLLPFVEKTKPGLATGQKKCNIRSAGCIGMERFKQFQSVRITTSFYVDTRQVPVSFQSARRRRSVSVPVRPLDVAEGDELFEQGR